MDKGQQPQCRHSFLCSRLSVKVKYFRSKPSHDERESVAQVKKENYPTLNKVKAIFCKIKLKFNREKMLITVS